MSSIKPNGFIMYCKERKPQLEAEGYTFPGGIQNVISFVSREWQALSPEEKLPYKEAATAARYGPKFQYLNDVPPPVTRATLSNKFVVYPDGCEYSKKEKGKEACFGFCMQEIEETAKNLRFAAAAERHEILSVFDPRFVPDSTTAIFGLINVSIYGTWGSLEDGISFPAELGLVLFTLRDGILSTFSKLIDPGQLPLGMQYEARNASKENGLPYPPFSEECRNYSKIIQEFHDFLDTYPSFKPDAPIFFCMRTDMMVIDKVLSWLYGMSDTPPRPYKLHSLPLLFQQLIRVGSQHYDEYQFTRAQMSFSETWNNLLPPVDYKGGIPFVIQGGPVRARNLPRYHEVLKEKLQKEAEAAQREKDIEEIKALEVTDFEFDDEEFLENMHWLEPEEFATERKRQKMFQRRGTLEKQMEDLDDYASSTISEFGDDDDEYQYDVLDDFSDAESIAAARVAAASVEPPPPRPAVLLPLPESPTPCTSKQAVAEAEAAAASALLLLQAQKTLNEVLESSNVNFVEQYGDIDVMKIFKYERDAREYLKSLDMAYAVEIGCPHHIINSEGIENCPTNKITRYAYNMLDVLVGFWRIIPIEGQHYPHADPSTEAEKRQAWYLAMTGSCGYLPFPTKSVIGPETAEYGGFQDSSFFHKQHNHLTDKNTDEDPAADLEYDHAELRRMTVICTIAKKKRLVDENGETNLVAVAGFSSATPSVTSTSTSTSTAKSSTRF